MRMDEQMLVKAAQSGDKYAFETLLRENEKLVYNLALKITGNQDDAFDVSQDAMLRAWRNIGSFRGESRFSVWLYRLTYNAAVDHIKKNRRGDVSLSDDDGREFDMESGDEPLEDVISRRENILAVRRAIPSLDDDKREILIMREYLGMEYRAIADALGVNEGTVKSRLARARSALARKLQADGTFSPGSASNNRKGGGVNA